MKYTAKMNKVGKAKMVREVGMGSEAEKMIIENSIPVHVYNKRSEKKEKYTKKKYLSLYKGYDFLQYLGVVRFYIQGKNKISNNMLEMLLYLYPINYFTQQDFMDIPKQFEVTRLKVLVDKELAKVAFVDEKDKSKKIYALSTKARNIVTDFYELLSGEKEFNMQYAANPFIGTKATAIDKKRNNLLKKFIDSPVPNHKKDLYR